MILPSTTYFDHVRSRVDVGDKKVYAKDIMKNPEDYFTEDVMSKIEEKVAEEFKYGTLEPFLNLTKRLPRRIQFGG